MRLEQPKPEDIINEEIRYRYVNNSRNSYTRHYLVKDGDREVGFLSLDFSPLDEPLVIYEVFVPRNLRKRGLGTMLLRAAEETAREHGYEWILVVPMTMDSVFSQADIEAWYRVNGYEGWEDHSFGGLRKRVAHSSA